MLVITVRFEVRPDAAEAFRARVLRQAADSLSKEPECHVFDVAGDPEHPGQVFLYEIYTDDAAFEAHLASDHFRAFDQECAEVVIAKSVERFQLLSPRAD